MTRPDLKALYQMASPLADMQVSDATLAANLQKAAIGQRGRDGKRLTFRFGDDESLKLIPECFKPDVKTARNRGAVEDYWDKGVTLPVVPDQLVLGQAAAAGGLAPGLRRPVVG